MANIDEITAAPIYDIKTSFKNLSVNLTAADRTAKIDELFENYFTVAIGDSY
jgi:hypothetical protein